jgi:mono/diheme cytochrome c family protein
MSEITPQQRREHSDPREGYSPVPLPIVILAGLLGAFCVGYILYVEPNSPPEWGDGRTLAELRPAATANAPASAPGVANQIDGEALFAGRCAACHQASGAGLPGVFPPLAKSEWVIGNVDTLSAIVLHGIEGELTVLSQPFNGVMPPFKDQLSDAEISALVTYIRSAWGNGAGAVDAVAVAKIRQETNARAGAFKGGVELAQFRP